MTRKHFAFVSILGAPNAGKSTLVNQMMQTKISIVSPKVQTTRFRVRAVLVEGLTQLVLVDTPGIFKPRRRLDRAMVADAWNQAEETDICLLLVDASKGMTEEVRQIVQSLQEKKKQVLLALNKIDLVPKEKLLPLIDAFRRTKVCSEIFMISAKTGQNITELKEKLISLAPKGIWLFPEDQLTDLPNRLFAAELTREKLFYHLQKELPYAVAVETLLWREDEKSIRIEQVIYVERTSQRAIVLGKEGAMIKKIGSSARLELQKILGKKVNLFLFVKVRENWTEDPNQYKPWGLDFNA